MPLILRALGASIGHHNYFFGPTVLMLAGADQLRFADSVILGAGVAVVGAIVDGQHVLIAPTRLREQCFVADRALVLPGCVLDREVLVGAQTMIPTFSRLHPGSVWSGLPAICLDPGTTDGAGDKGDTHSPRAGHTTQWQRSVMHLQAGATARVLTARGITSAEHAREIEGKGRLGRRPTATLEGAAGHGTPRAGRMFSFRGETSMLESDGISTLMSTQASSLVTSLQGTRSGGALASIIALVIPCVVVPLWLTAATMGPAYIVNAGFSEIHLVKHYLVFAVFCFGEEPSGSAPLPCFRDFHMPVACPPDPPLTSLSPLQASVASCCFWLLNSCVGGLRLLHIPYMASPSAPRCATEWCPPSAQSPTSCSWTP